MFTMPTIDMVATGRNIMRLREVAGLTVRDLQDIFGFATPQAIYKWQKGKSLRIRHQKRAGGQARQNHAEQRELKPPVFSCLPLFYSKTFIRPVFRLDMWNFMDYEIRPLQAAHILYPCVTSVAVCPCNRFSNRIWIAAAFFFVKIFHGEAARKISTKRFGKCGRQDKFDFPLMKGETVLAISIRLSS